MLIETNLSSNPAWIVFAFVIAGILVFLYNNYVRVLKARAAAGDHLVECGREIAVPDHCVSCGRPHADKSTRVMPRVVGLGPIIPLIDPRFRTKYFFLYCGACAAPIRSQRLVGAVLLGITFVLLGVTVLAALIWVIGFPKPNRAPDVVQATGLLGLVATTLIGLPFAIVGQRLHRYSPGVWILDDGGSTILIHFRNQVYRNHFAKMNGAPIH